MSSAIEKFHAELYREHIETGGFVHEQWAAVMASPMPDLENLLYLEQRLEAHLDALILAGDKALSSCREFLESEPGERHVIARVFCRLQAAADLRKLLAVEHSPQASLAVVRALASDLPETWLHSLARNLAHPDSGPFSILAPVVGRRRLPAVEALEASWERLSEAEQDAWFWTRGRINIRPEDDPLSPRLKPLPVTRKATGARALLRLGLVAQSLALFPPEQPDGFLNIAIAADKRAFDTLMSYRQHPIAVIALGVLGDIRAMQPMLTMLSDPVLGGAAAWGLRLLTGKAPLEQQFIPEPVTEDSLFPVEGRRYQLTGVPPQGSQGRPFGQQLMRLSRNPSHWAMSISDTRQRIRGGEPATPLGLLKPLLESGWPLELRQLALDELLVRHGIDAQVEADQPINEQRPRLLALGSKLAQMPFQAGAWYLGGAPG